MDERAVRIKQFWEDRGRRIEDPTIAARFREDDRLEHDLRLARSFCTADSRVLDLGAGACGLSFHLAPYVREIVAVDFVHELLEKRPLPPNIKPVVADIRDFETEDTFDVVLVYGVFNYILDDDDLSLIYRGIHRMLAPNGVCIIKHQSGVRETLTVDRFSEEFKTRYIAVYRHMDREIELLESLFKVEMLDVYPAHLNRWDNTHFYAYVCRRRESARDSSLAA